MLFACGEKKNAQNAVISVIIQRAWCWPSWLWCTLACHDDHNTALLTFSLHSVSPSPLSPVKTHFKNRWETAPGLFGCRLVRPHVFVISHCGGAAIWRPCELSMPHRPQPTAQHHIPSPLHCVIHPFIWLSLPLYTPLVYSAVRDVIALYVCVWQVLRIAVNAPLRSLWHFHAL